MAKNKGNPFFTFVLLPIILVAIIFPIWRTLQSGNPLSYMYPNLLLFTPYRAAAKNAWTSVISYPTEKATHPHIPVIEYKDFTLEKLKKATKNWRSPAIVRGMFSGTPATTKWAEDGYLSSKIGKYNIPVVRNAKYNTMQNNRTVIPFHEAFTDIITNPDSMMYLFFPVKSRFNFNHSDLGAMEELQAAVDKIMLDDLEINKRIWNGFGTKAHSTYFGGQFVIGRGQKEVKDTTGTGWHCAAGNNWFAQVSYFESLRI
jgi:hypothetical protein